MCIFEWAEVSKRAKCWFSFIQMEGSEANCSYWGKGGCSYASLISANLSDGHFLFLFEIVLFLRAVWLLMFSVEVWLGLWRSVGLLFWHGGWYIYRSAGAKASSISERREGGSFPHYLLSSQLLTCKCASEMQPPQTPGTAGQDWMKVECLKCQADQSLPDWHDAWCAVLCLISN